MVVRHALAVGGGGLVDGEGGSELGAGGVEAFDVAGVEGEVVGGPDVADDLDVAGDVDGDAADGAVGVGDAGRSPGWSG